MRFRDRYRSDGLLQLYAVNLLREFGKAHKPIKEPPVPVEDIIENHLKLHLEITDLNQAYGVDDALGALDVLRRTITIDSRLDPYEHPKMLGRYCFTAAHEVGHWQVHLTDREKRGLFYIYGPNSGNDTVLCRQSQARARTEIQADMFAASLLIPPFLLVDAWNAVFGNTLPIRVREDELTPLPDDPGHQVGTLTANEQGDQNRIPPACDRLFTNVARIFAPKFQVSVQAMKIRLISMRQLIVLPPASAQAS